MNELLVVHALVVVSLLVVVVTIAVRLGCLLPVFVVVIVSIVLVVSGGVVSIIGEISAVVILACNAAKKSTAERVALKVRGMYTACSRRTNQAIHYYSRVELERIS